jgi:hypothetical protein
VHNHSYSAPLISLSLAVHAKSDFLTDEVCQVKPVVHTSTYTRSNMMSGLYADYGGYDLEMPVSIGPVNPKWRDIVIEFAKTRKYNGFSRDEHPRGNEVSLIRYEDDVKRAIFLCQGPRSGQDAVDFVASFCAVALCEGRAKAIVQQLVERHGKLPLKRELFFRLKDDVKTQPIHFWIPGYNCP